MEGLLDSIFKLVQNKHPSTVKNVALAVNNQTNAREVLKSKFEQELFDYIKETATKECYSTEKLAGLIEGIAQGALLQKESEDTEVVWTGPDTNVVPVRRSAQVLKSLIDRATDKVFIVSYVSFNLPEIDESIRQALKRNVQVNLLLETADKRTGDRFLSDAIRYMEKFIGINVFQWPAKNRPPVGQSVASVHAKCAVADGREAFVTSANLTEAAMDKNIELGLLLTGGDVPKEISDHLFSLVDQNVIIPLS
jgi:phosphatidylserine/phosphatidylglycerophosphate/cardiolipin synthase-like enzyme